MSIVTYPYKRWKGWRVPMITFGIRHGDKWFPSCDLHGQLALLEWESLLRHQDDGVTSGTFGV